MSADPKDFDEAAVAIILRRRPDLKGKSLKEIRAILKQQIARPKRRRGRSKKPPHA
jgi:hypothetical protein